MWGGKWELSGEKIQGKTVLVVGLGGGCDVISAYCMAKYIKEFSPKKVLYGNTIGPRTIPDAQELYPNVFSFSTPPIPLDTSCVQPYWGTVRIEQSLPQDGEGSPFLFVVPHREGGSIHEITQRNKHALKHIVEMEKWDLIIGVDAGGDSLTGGIDFKAHPALGRDRQMLTVLSSLGIEFWHLLIAPCCDGETSREEMDRFLQLSCSEQLVLGSFHLPSSVIESLEHYSKGLSNERTTNIIVNASRSLDEMLTIPRGIRPQVPTNWMKTVIVLKWPSTMTACYLLPPEPHL